MIYGDEIDYSRVRSFNGRFPLLRAMAPDGNIYFPGDCGNLAICGGLSTSAAFIHEMAHVHQFQGGIDVLVRAIPLQVAHSITFGLFNPYEYGTFDRPYDYYNIEQQGDIARDIYIDIKLRDR